MNCTRMVKIVHSLFLTVLTYLPHIHFPNFSHVLILSNKNSARRCKVNKREFFCVNVRIFSSSVFGADGFLNGYTGCDG